ncbi:MAG: hypothetical protein IPM16_16710 [Chloroflexi bacterium]|nr:hypothetical protein [Chloroflexota bacterium]
MIGEWLAREGWIVASWWLIATAAGAAALPLAWRFLGALPDRGWLLARPLGLLTTGAVFWLLTSLGFLRNEPGAIVLSGLIVLGAGLLALNRVPDLSGRPDTLRSWWQRNRWAVIAVELLFVALLVLWAIVRAHQNNVVTTEKPMDLAFLASIVRSETFPPQDPWLSGYAISYYYFGYVIAGMFTKLSGVVAGVGYNLWTAMLFALTGVTAFGVVYNLVRVHGSQIAGILVGLIGLYAVAVMGNYQMPLVDMPYMDRTASEDYLALWDVRDRQSPLAQESPAWDYWWWFRSARVLHDRNLPGMPGASEEVINEFPMFSYVLADNHPHVMALPFALLAMGIGLSLALNKSPAGTAMAVFAGVTVGGLIFLNTWDTPIYLALIVGAEALRRYAHTWGRFKVDDGIALVAFGGLTVGTMLVFYLPFLVSFGSQLGGALPNFVHPTATQQLLLAFGALFPLTILYLAVEGWRGGRALNWRTAAFTTAGVFLAILGVMALLSLLGAVNPSWLGPQQDYLTRAGGEAWGAMLLKRGSHVLTTVLLLVGVFVVAARLFGRPYANGMLPFTLPTGYALLMVGGALLLVLVPDYVYLRDGFGSRMNTVFKFYYQAWALLGIATAYGVWTILDGGGEKRLPSASRIGLAILPVVLYGLGTFYPLKATTDRMFVETGRSFNDFPGPLTLNGAPTLTNPNDYAALMCLRGLTEGQADVVAVEVSFHGSYDYFAGGIASGRLAGITGLPTVIGWQGHQRQWRGRGYDAAVASRPADIQQLYTDLRLDVVQQIIDRYGIDYIVYGNAERARYGSDGELKFREGLPVVCESGDTRIYRTSSAAANPALQN